MADFTPETLIASLVEVSLAAILIMGCYKIPEAYWRDKPVTEAVRTLIIATIFVGMIPALYVYSPIVGKNIVAFVSGVLEGPKT